MTPAAVQTHLLHEEMAQDVAEDQDLPFEYQPLPSMDHIRILIIQPGLHNDPIRCNLQEIPLDGAECQYEGISYAWGDKNDFCDIICDGKKLTIRANLGDALRTFRYVSSPRTVWADAVCINQKDHTEKGYQVRRMGEIYQKASRVLCWLGRDNLGIAESCFELVRKANRQLAEQWQSGWTFANVLNDLKLPHLINDDTREEWQKFELLLDLAWFQRLW